MQSDQFSWVKKIRIYSKPLLQRDPLNRMFNKNKNLRPLIKSDSQPKEGVQKQGDSHIISFKAQPGSGRP